MGIKDLILSLPPVRNVMQDALIRAREEGRSQRVAEAVEPDYYFRRLSGSQGVYELGEAVAQNILVHAHRAYQSNGLADFIVQRAASIFLEGGLTYQLTFDELADDADVETRKMYDDFRRATEERIETWWNHDDVDIDERSAQFVDELLVSGEHGWRLHVDDSNGWVSIGDFPRTEVGDIYIDAFDTTRMRDIVPLNPSDPSLGALRVATRPREEAQALKVLHYNPQTRRREGDVAYHRLRPTATMRRGRPILQSIVDDLSGLQRFRLLSSDRAISRMTTFLETKIEGAKDTELEAFAKKYGTTMPAAGSRVWVNENWTNTFVSSNIEASDVSTWIQSMTISIAAAMGWPISWFAYGNDTNRATAETQEDPAYRNLNRQKRQLMKFFERVLYFVVDCGFARRYLDTGGGEREFSVKGREEGSVIKKPLRECLTITVSTRPLAQKQKDASPLSATEAAMKVLTLLSQLRRDYGADILTPEQIATLLNAGFSTDGVGIEVFGDKLFPDAEPNLDANA